MNRFVYVLSSIFKIDQSQLMLRLMKVSRNLSHGNVKSVFVKLFILLFKRSTVNK